MSMKHARDQRRSLVGCSVRTRCAVLMCVGGVLFACEPAQDPSFGVTSADARGTTPPGPTPTPGPTCLGPTSIQTPVNVQSTTYAPAVNAYATTANAGYFRSGGMALEATTAAPGATALLATANASNGIAIQAQAYSDRGVTLSIEAHGGADLLHAQRDGDAAPRFRIANDANVYVNGTLVTEFGPTGDPGLDGRDGTNGANGAPGPRGFGATYALCTDASSCLNRCKGGWIAVQAVGPCVVGADFGTCGRLGEDGVCCVCGT